VPNLPQYVTDTTSQTGTDVQANYVKNLPNYMNMVGADVGNIQNNLAGTLAPDVIQQLQQQGAERGISTGAPGSDNSNAAYLRALGLTSLQLQQLGHSQLTEAMQRTPVQQTQMGSATRDLGEERAIYAAAPQPGPMQRQALANARSGMTQGQKLAGGAPSYAQFAGGGGGGGSPGAAWAAANTSNIGPFKGVGGLGPFDTYDPAGALARWKAEAAQWSPARAGSGQNLFATAPYMPGQQPMLEDPGFFGSPYAQPNASPYKYYDEGLAEASVDAYDQGDWG
jgi:hypothetical protein